MVATAVTGSCNTTTFFPLSLPKPPPSQKLFPLPRQLLHSYKRTTPQICSRSAPNSAAMSPRSVSSPENGVVAEEEEEEERAEQSDDVVSSSSPSLPPLTGCKGCGREEIERGCNGEGRIQGGIATVPGFGWWPIKAYRPCPAYLQSGGRYRRTGQSMDEVVSGRAGQ
ncbi:hypothetical protein C2S53_008077 [Perilla frutescens var. hirtella]|uniref:Uncharacterized protein n=1 Tax=Perilla frutescens var. hirtella TaxID=608512 RepID=A0AAD4IWV7_PERFH|nr:hypothetical protein C2S53_008077 [Perilla frutescens var. hirtella]